MKPAKHDRLETVVDTKDKYAASEPWRINLCHLHEVYRVGSRTDEVNNGTHHGLQGWCRIAWIALGLEAFQLSIRVTGRCYEPVHARSCTPSFLSVSQ